MGNPTLNTGSVTINGGALKGGRYQIPLGTPVNISVVPSSSGDASGQVKLFIKWGDNTQSRLGDWYNVGQLEQFLHSYQYQGDYYIAVQAFNAAGSASNIATIPLRLVPQQTLNQQLYRWSGLALPVDSLQQSFAVLNTVIASTACKLVADANVGDTFILVDSPQTFVVGSQLVITSPGLYLTSASVIEIDGDRIFLDTALNDSYTTTSTIVTVKATDITRSGAITQDSNWAFPISRDKDLAKSAVFAILSTRKGEMIMDPNFGCDIHKRLFEPDDPLTMQLAYADVSDALTTYEFRVGIASLTVSASPTDRDNNRMVMNLVLYFLDEGPDQTFDMSVPIG